MLWLRAMMGAALFLNLAMPSLAAQGDSPCGEQGAVIQMWYKYNIIDGMTVDGISTKFRSNIDYHDELNTRRYLCAH